MSNRKPHSEETKRKMSESQQGRKRGPMSEEQKEKIRQAHLGKPKSEAVRESIRQRQIGNTIWVGRKHSEATRRKLSEQRLGNRSSSWNGGSSEENRGRYQHVDYKLWREAVYSRDDFTCAKTGERGGVLRPHHIYSWSKHPQIRLDVYNGITMTEEAHDNFHKTYGYSCDLFQLEQFIGRELPLEQRVYLVGYEVAEAIQKDVLELTT